MRAGGVGAQRVKNSQEDRRFNRRIGSILLIINRLLVVPRLAAATAGWLGGCREKLCQESALRGKGSQEPICRRRANKNGYNVNRGAVPKRPPVDAR